VVLTDSKNSTKSGKFLEILGTYDAVHNKKEIKADRVKHWMSHGAKLSETVHNWLIDEKVIPGKKINNLPKKSPIKKEEPKKEGEAAAPVAAKAAEAVPAPAAETPKA